MNTQTENKKATFTQGEWKLKGVIVSAGETHIADCAIGRADVPYINIEDEEKANAKLIASAPELLQVLRSVLQEIDRPNFTDRYGTVDRIKSVIEKATA